MCDLLNIGRIHERIGETEKALYTYLKVCYYDLNGASNSYNPFDSEDIFLAPAVIDWINKIIKKLYLSKEDIEAMFKEVMSESKEDGMFMKENICLKCMEKALYGGLSIRGKYSEVLEQILCSI